MLIPIAVLAIGVVLFFPRWFPSESPTYDFLYASKASSTSSRAKPATSTIDLESGYAIAPGTVAQTITQGDPDIRVYLHHVEANSSVPLSIEDIGNYAIVPGTVDPAGFTFVRLEPGWFDTNRRERYALVKGINKKILNLNIPNDGSVEVLFLGWVK